MKRVHRAYGQFDGDVKSFIHAREEVLFLLAQGKADTYLVASMIVKDRHKKEGVLQLQLQREHMGVNVSSN